MLRLPNLSDLILTTSKTFTSWLTINAKSSTRTFLHFSDWAQTNELKKSNKKHKAGQILQLYHGIYWYLGDIFIINKVLSLLSLSWRWSVKINLYFLNTNPHICLVHIDCSRPCHRNAQNQSCFEAIENFH